MLWGGELSQEYEVKILKEDFDRADGLVEEQAEKAIQNVDEHHYLFDFTNEELYDILLKPDEWNAFDFKLAAHILKKEARR